MDKKLENELAELYAKRHNLEKKLEPIKKRIVEINTIKRREEDEELEKLKKENKEFMELVNKYDADYFFLERNNKWDEREIFEDDGTLHVVYGRLRACLINNQNLSRSEWLKRAKPIIKELIDKFGYKKENIRI